MKIRYFSRSALVLVLASLFCAAAHADTEKSALAKRADNIERLLYASSGAKQIVNGVNQAAHQKRNDAVILYENALVEMARGNNPAAAQMLDDASRIMFAAIKLATPSKVAEEKDVSDYQNRRESVSALRDAFDRISQEDKALESNRSKVNGQLDELVGQAEDLMNKGEIPKARLEIDKAYHLVKVSIDSIRSGQTLIRSLNFETPRDEYLYELDRNDTHSMLVGLLIDDQKQSAYSKDNVAKKIIEADELRAQAESYAAQEAYEQAIDLLEQSTKQLVRAIRSAGIYIPG